MSVEALLAESNAVNNFRFRQVEKFPQGTAGVQSKGQQNSTTQDVKCDDSIVSDIVKARQIIQLSLASSGDGAGRPSDERVQLLESRVCELEDVVKKLTSLIENLNLNQASKPAPAPAKAATPATRPKAAAPTPADDDDDVDLFGSDDEVDEAAEKLKQERIAAYAAKKSKKPGPIAKSNVILDVKPWDDETDMKQLEAAVRTIEMEGLVWGVSKLVPLAYGIKKLQIVCVVVDDLVSIDELSEKIQEFEDFVQSVDIAAFQKI